MALFSQLRTLSQGLYQGALELTRGDSLRDGFVILSAPTRYGGHHGNISQDKG